MPWSLSRFDDGGDAPQPVLNAPAVAVAVAASMPLLYLVQRWVGDAWVEALAFRPASLFDGGWWPGLFSAMFVHGGWAHAGMNAVFALAFGTPVARLLPGPRGVAAFLLFYMACGVVASAGYGLVHPHSQDALVGASGAVFGLVGAGIRLMGGQDRLRPLTDRGLLTTAGLLMLINAAFGLIGVAPGSGGAVVAWEAHAFGFLFGLLMIGPVARIVSGAPDSFDSPDDLRDPPV